MFQINLRFHFLITYDMELLELYRWPQERIKSSIRQLNSNHTITYLSICRGLSFISCSKGPTEELLNPFDRENKNPTTLTNTKYGVSRMKTFKSFSSRECKLEKLFCIYMQNNIGRLESKLWETIVFFIDLLEKRNMNTEKHIWKF